MRMYYTRRMPFIVYPARRKFGDCLSVALNNVEFRNIVIKNLTDTIQESPDATHV